MIPIKLVDVVLITLILLSCCATIFLALENTSLKAELNGTTPLETDTSVISSNALPIRIKSLANEVDSLSFDHQTVPTILFIFTTTCPHCEESFTAWKSSSTILDSVECNIVGISLDDIGPTKLLKEHQAIPFTIVLNADTSLMSNYKIGGVPQTVVVSPLGIITHVWRGRFDVTMIPGLVTAIRDSSIHYSGGHL